MKDLYEQLVTTIFDTYPVSSFKYIEVITEHGGELRMVVNADAVRGIQIGFWDNEFIEVDILPEYFPSAVQETNPEKGFNTRGHFFTSVGGHCFLFERQTDGLLKGIDVTESGEHQIKTLTNQQFVQMVMHGISN